MEYICVGVPYWIGERQTISAVDAVKNSGIAAELGTEWVDIQPDFTSYEDPVVAVNRALAGVIQAYPLRIPLIFSGDCVSALGAVKGLETKRPAVLWYDAHGDFNTPETTISGFLGGMPLAALVGRGNEALMAAIGLEPLMESDVLLTDARDLDPAERELLKSSAVKHLPEVSDLLTVTLPAKPLYIHLDTDVVNPDEIPATTYATAGGPSVAEVVQTLHRVREESEIAGVLFSLWNQEKHGAKLSLDNTLQLVRALIQER
jgi:arginase